MKVILLIVAGFLVGPYSFAGPGISGGGAGIFCPPTVVDQPAVQLLDLYEGRVGDSLVIPELPTSFETQLHNLIAALDFDFSLRLDFEQALTTIRANAIFLPPGVGIHVPPDLGEAEAVLVPTGCMIGGIGYYESSDQLKVSADAYGALSETQKAAFWAHEAFYKLARYYRVQGRVNSKSTRKFVAYAFSQNKTSTGLASLGKVGGWFNFDETFIHPKYSGYYGFAGWAPSVGKESWFLPGSGTGRVFNPILLPSRQGAEVEIRVTPDMGGRIKVAYNTFMYCINFEHEADGWRKQITLVDNEEYRYEETYRSVHGFIPANCQVLYFEVQNSEVAADYTLRINGQEILSGHAAQAVPGTSQYFVVYLPLYVD